MKIVECVENGYTEEEEEELKFSISFTFEVRVNEENPTLFASAYIHIITETDHNSITPLSTCPVKGRNKERFRANTTSWLEGGSFPNLPEEVCVEPLRW